MENSNKNPSFGTILEKLSIHRVDPKLAFRFLGDGDNETQNISYETLNLEVDKLASNLGDQFKKGERVLLIYPSSIEFIISFLACLKIGLVAVPVNPPTSHRRLGRLETIFNDSQASGILSIEKIHSKIAKWLLTNDLLKDSLVFLTDNVTEANSTTKFPNLKPDDLAFLQYTSGSTGNPKGVMVSHKNLYHNCGLIADVYNLDYDTMYLGWLPMFHDMGLIGNIMTTIYAGGTLVSMSPVNFVRKPIRWLNAISTYKITITGAPNFAFDLCVEGIKDEDIAHLDLSSCNVYFCGAEPVKSKHLGCPDHRHGVICDLD